MNPWPTVPLGEVLNHRKEFVQIDDLVIYKRCRVQLHAQGVVLRDQVPGIEIKTKKQQVCKANDFLVAEIDAKLGGYGIVPRDLEGAIVSSHYFLFVINEKKIDRHFLEYFLRTQTFHEQVAAQGSTNYAAIRPGHVLEYTIPFPPLPEQRRLVERIDALALKIGEARHLRAEADKEVNLLSASVPSVFPGGWGQSIKTMEELVGRVNLRNGKSLKQTSQPTDIKCLSLSAMRDGIIDCRDAKPVPMTRAEAAQYTVRKSDVFVVRGNGSKQLVGRAGLIIDDVPDIIYPDLFIKVPLDKTTLLADYFVLIWNSKSTRVQIEEVCKTTSGIWKINQGHIASIAIPVPPVEEQRRIVTETNRVKHSVAKLRPLQKQSRLEVNALLPAVLDRAFRGDL